MVEMMVTWMEMIVMGYYKMAGFWILLRKYF